MTPTKNGNPSKNESCRKWIQQFPRYKPNHSRNIKITDYRSSVNRAVRRHRIYGRTDSCIYGTHQHTVREVSGTADGTAGARPAYCTDLYRQSRLWPYLHRQSRWSFHGQHLAYSCLACASRSVHLREPDLMTEFLGQRAWSTPSMYSYNFTWVRFTCRLLHNAPVPPPGIQNFLLFNPPHQRDRTFY
jgi:hypothetical protein